MNTVKKKGLFGMLLLVVAASTNAGVLVTPPYEFDYAADEVWCTITNNHNKKVANGVVIDTVDYFGTVVNTTSGDMPPGSGMALLGDPNAAYCRFTVPGSTKKFSAGASYSSGGALGAHFPAR